MKSLDECDGFSISSDKAAQKKHLQSAGVILATFTHLSYTATAYNIGTPYGRHN